MGEGDRKKRSNLEDGAELVDLAVAGGVVAFYKVCAPSFNPRVWES